MATQFQTHTLNFLRIREDDSSTEMLINNEMDDFFKPGTPNGYGLLDLRPMLLKAIKDHYPR